MLTNSNEQLLSAVERAMEMAKRIDPTRINPIEIEQNRREALDALEPVVLPPFHAHVERTLPEETTQLMPDFPADAVVLR